MVNGKDNGRHDAMGVVDVDPASSGYGHIVGQVDMPHAGDELHHFGWNACSACLYVSFFGTGEFLQYDVSDPFHPRKTGSVHLGGIVRKAAHPKHPKSPLNGAPQMVEVSRDGRRIYFTNSLYAPWDAQFYPEGIQSWMVKLDAKPEGGMAIDPKFFVDFGELRGHQVRLEGGDASSDSYCYA